MSWHTLRLRPRLALGALAGFLIAVPVTLLALAVRGGWSPLARVDRSVADGLHAAVIDQPVVVAVLRVIAVVFDPWVFRLLVLGLVIVLFRRGARRLAWWAAITMLAGSLTGFLAKLLIGRARPSFAEPAATAPGFSFPSGHALNSAVAALVIVLVVLPALRSLVARVGAWLGAAAVVLVTGLDRIALGVHYVSDVVAGWLVAAALVAGTAGAFETWRHDVGLPAHDPLEGVDPEEAEQLA